MTVSILSGSIVIFAMILMVYNLSLSCFLRLLWPWVAFSYLTSAMAPDGATTLTLHLEIR